MTRLDRYIIRQIIPPSVTALAVITFLAVANEIRQRISEMPAALITFSDVSRLAIFFVPSLTTLVVPVTFLFGILLTFGRLAQQGELTAMKASGISLKRVAAPVIVAGALLSILSFFMQDRIQPWAVNKAFALVYDELPRRATIDALAPGIMHDYEGWRVYFETKDPENGLLLNIDLVRPGDVDGPSVFHAESAEFLITQEGYELALTNGHLIMPNNLLVKFDSQRLSVPSPSSKKIRDLRRSRTLAELIAFEKALVEQSKAGKSMTLRNSLANERREIADRTSLPFAALAVTLIAATLGARASTGGRSYTIAVGFIVILLYYVLTIALIPHSLHRMHDYVIRAWVPNIILMITGSILLWRLDRV